MLMKQQIKRAKMNDNATDKTKHDDHSGAYHDVILTINANEALINNDEEMGA